MAEASAWARVAAYIFIAGMLVMHVAPRRE
jgi:hypothetical protein